MVDFTGFPKEDFRQLMINYWMKNENYEKEVDALEAYGGHDFDAFCDRLDNTSLLNFKYDLNSLTECFEVIDNNFVIPVSAINIYTGK